MWLSFNILSQLVDISGLTPEEIAARLTMSTAEIDGIEYMNQHFRTIVTAKAVDVKPHPNADKLTLVDADTGNEKLRVVCGATNHKAGDIVALALVGTKFSMEFEIKKSKIRGEESSGMLCSAKELGLSDDHSGIMIFPEGTPIGKPLSEIFKERVDVRMEIDNKSITHRPDLWSHVGFAREIGAIFGRKVFDPVKPDLKKDFKKGYPLTVTIKNHEGSPRYTGLVVKNIKIAESPEWLKAAVSAIGMRPINNIVDITNYVMSEIGEPMHAFDKKKLIGDEIIVRNAAEGEKLTTLDGQNHTLISEDIVIADKSGAIALAGVMGGGNSEIDDTTTEIVLEAANFNPVNIRKTAQRYSLRTEAAIRFEKALSPEITEAAIIRCYDLIKQVIPGAAAASDLIDAYPVKPGAVKIDITFDHIRKNLGEDISDDRIKSILDSLDFKTDVHNGKLTVQVPHYRATKDISIQADIVEEVGRIYGYDNIEPVSPLVTCEIPAGNPFRTFEREIKNILSRDFGQIETSGYSFVGEDILNRLKINEDKELRLKNPLSVEQDRLRRSLIPDIMQFIQSNIRYNDSFGIYELGRVYVKDSRTSPDLISENTRVAGAVYSKKSQSPLFYEAKNIVSGIAEKLRLRDFSFRPASDNIPPYAHQKRSVRLYAGDREAGLIFEPHPETAAAFDITGSSALYDIDLNVLFEAEKNELKFTELRKFPEVPFEISVIADSKANAGDIIESAVSSAGGLIVDINVISVYEGSPIPDGKKSVSMKIIFASKEKTLSTEEIVSLQNGVIKSLEKSGYQLR